MGKNNTRYTDNLFTYKIPEFLVDDILKSVITGMLFIG